jgi:catechol 2,3-dioxygenase-like lactoylglutathione lyase family enzyme
MKRAFCLLSVFSAWAFAQLPPGNAAGVAMGHLHFKTPDVEAHRKLWVDVLGGTPSKLGARDIVTLPGLVVLYEKGESAGGSIDSVVSHVGVKVRDFDGVVARARAAGIAKEEGKNFLLLPDGVRVEITPDPAIGAPAVNHHIHLYSIAVDDMKAWYVKMFGAAPGRRGNMEAADLPGVNLTFSKSDKPLVPTKGRALDHIGFEVTGLEAYVKKLEAAGVKFDVPYRSIPALGISIAFLTDPWGTYIELTEGLRK